MSTFFGRWLTRKRRGKFSFIYYSKARKYVDISGDTNPLHRWRGFYSKARKYVNISEGGSPTHPRWRVTSPHNVIVGFTIISPIRDVQVIGYKTAHS